MFGSVRSATAFAPGRRSGPSFQSLRQEPCQRRATGCLARPPPPLAITTKIGCDGNDGRATGLGKSAHARVLTEGLLADGGSANRLRSATSGHNSAGNGVLVHISSSVSLPFSGLGATVGGHSASRSGATLGPGSCRSGPPRRGRESLVGSCWTRVGVAPSRSFFQKEARGCA